MTTVEQAEDEWRARGIRWGIIAGGICVSLFAGVYFLDRPTILIRELWLGSLLIYLFGMYQAQRFVEGDDLKAYIQPGFMVFVVANAIFYGYYHLLFSVFDPELVQLQAEMLAANGQDPKDAAAPTISSSFLSYAQSLIFGFGLAAATGFIIRLRNNN
ncbi:MAG: hypothetical protein AAGJ93_16180 [Bacteroidota bacterium]